MAWVTKLSECSQSTFFEASKRSSGYRVSTSTIRRSFPNGFVHIWFLTWYSVPSGSVKLDTKSGCFSVAKSCLIVSSNVRGAAEDKGGCTAQEGAGRVSMCRR